MNGRRGFNTTLMLLLLIGFFSLGVPLEEEEEDKLNKWVENMSDFRFDCSKDLGDSDATNSQLFTVVDCDGNGATYNYKYESKAKGCKIGRTFEGLGTLTFPLSVFEQGKFNYGLKHGKCLKINNSNMGKMRSVSGNFVSDKLQGRVVVGNADDTETVLYVKDNRPVGLIRTFRNKQLLNITTTQGNLIFNHLGGGTSLRCFEEQSYTLFTTTDNIKYRCRVVGNDAYLADCKEIESLVTVQNDFGGIRIKSFSTATTTMFHYNLAEDAKFSPWSKDDPFSFCSSSSSSNNNNVTIRESLEAWISKLTNMARDPFWPVLLNDITAEAVEETGPDFDVVLNHYVDRPEMDGTPVRVLSGDMVLWTGTMVAGVIRGAFDKGGPQEWSGPLIFDLMGSIPENKANGVFYTAPNKTFNHAVSGRLKNGRLHGPVRMVGRASNDPAVCGGRLLEAAELAFVGYYEEGRPKGVCWRGLLGGGWVYGKVDPKSGDFTGDLAYIYPDMKTALRGSFRKGLMVNAREVEVIGERCKKGIKILQFSKPQNPDRFFHYKPPTETEFGDQPHLRDPLDDRYVWLGPSLEIPAAGEGVFAKVDVPKDTVFVIYSGRRLTKVQTDDNNRVQEERLLKQQQQQQQQQPRSLLGGNISNEEERLWADKKYSINMHMCSMSLYIPAEFESTERYQGSLGHKLNHKFIPNSKFCQIDSPRYGIVIAEKTLRKVEKGEEFFVHYGYSFNGGGPDWYREELRKYLKQNPDFNREQLTPEGLNDM